MVTLLANSLAALLLGGMVFFPAVVAPTVFKALPAEAAGSFLRSLFPRYYSYLIVLFGLLTLLVVGQSFWAAGGFAAAALSTLWVRQVVMPQVNAARDAMTSGDLKAKTRFERGHRLCVVINMVQLLGLLCWWTLSFGSFGS